MKILLFLLILLTLSLTVSSQKTATREVPADELELRDKLEVDSSILRIECSRSRKQYPNEESLQEAEKEFSRLRLLAYEASLSNDKTAMLKQTCSSKEATKNTSYLIVDKGKVKFISDSSRDRFGYMRVLTYECEKLLIGSYAFDVAKSAMIFTPVSKPEELGEKVPFLQCHTKNREFVF